MERKQRPRWTDADIRKVKERRLAGETLQAIANDFKVTRERIRQVERMFDRLQERGWVRVRSKRELAKLPLCNSCGRRWCTIHQMHRDDCPCSMIGHDTVEQKRVGRETYARVVRCN